MKCKTIKSCTFAKKCTKRETVENSRLVEILTKKHYTKQALNINLDQNNNKQTVEGAHNLINYC